MKRPGLILFLWVVLLALCAWPFTVRAAGTVSPGVSQFFPSDAYWGVTGPYATVQAGAQDVLSRAQAANAGCQYRNLTEISALSWSFISSGCGSPILYFTAGSASCPANSSALGSVCQCASGYVPGGDPYGSACVSAASVCPDFAAGIAPGYVYPSATSSVTVCDSATACQFRGSLGACIGSDCAVVGPYTATGSDCSGGTAPVAGSCPAGQVSSTVGGNTVCVPATTTSTTSSTQSSSPAGAASAPPTTVTGGGGTTVGVPPGGSTESTTTCTGSACTTSTVVRDSSGTVVGTVSQAGSRDSFCTENPEASICKSSSFAESCAAGASVSACEGDAIQCAIAAEQHARNCQLFEGQHETRTLAENALNGVPDSDHPGASGNVSSIAIDEMIDTAPIIGAGSCPADVGYSVPILGTMVVPWSRMCSWLELMGTILVAAAGVTWLFIVFGSKGV